MQKKKSLELVEPTLARVLGLQRLRPPTPLLAEWFASVGALDENELSLLGEACLNLLDNADAWNEEELKMHFISILILLAKYKDPLRVYFDREISANIEGNFLKTEADMLVSKGIGELIETPYFFLHEYKREKKYTGDPIGQLLAGMLIAQAKNKDNKPVYGCYVQGRFWFFAILTGKEYVISQPLVASELQDAIQIVYMLRFIKTLYLL